MRVEECLPFLGRIPASVNNVPRDRWNQPHEREHLGEQREVIAEDVRRWLYDTQPDPWQRVDVWYGLHNWITGQ